MATPDEIRAFAAQYGPLVANAAQRYGVDPGQMLSQIALETGYGRSVIPGTNNPGNIKQFGGGGVSAVDNMLGTSDRYRAYDSLGAGVDAMGSLLARRYGGGSNLKGYAEDPNYMQKIGGVGNTLAKYASDVLGFVTGSRNAYGDEPSPAQRAYANAQGGPNPPPASATGRNVMTSARAANFGPGQQQQTDDDIFAPSKASPANAGDTGSGQTAGHADDSDIFGTSKVSGYGPAVEARKQAQAGAGAAASAPAGATPATAPAAAQGGQPPGQRGFWGRTLDAVTDPGQWGHQLGLTAREGLEGAASAAGVVVDPVNALINTATGAKLPTLQGATTDLLNRVGLPQAANSTERVVGDATRALASVAATGGAGGALAGAANPAVAAAGQGLASNLGTQFGSAIGSAGASGSAREGGLSPTMQLGAGLLGGLAGGAAAQGVGSLYDRLTRQTLAPNADALGATTGTEDMSANARRSLSENPTPEQTARMQQLAQQNPNATPAQLRRAAEFDALGIEPTTGQLTRDPTQFADELNYRRTQPALANRFNQQDARLGDVLGGLEQTAPLDRYQAGQGLVDSFEAIDRQAGQRVSDAYTAARNSAGARLDVPTTGLAQDYGTILRDFEDKIPTAVRSRFNSYGLGDVGNQTRTMDMNDANELTKLINSHVGSDPTTNLALSRLRGAVNDAVQSAPDGGGTFTQAKQLAQQRFQAREMMPLLDDAAARSANPETAFQRYIVGGQTPQVEAMAETMRTSAPDQFAQTRAQMQNYLEQAAFGNGAEFRPAGYMQALERLGPRKLAAFFSPDEVNQINSVGRVGYLMKGRPSGSPVNTSNTATALLGHGLMSNLAGRLPVVGPLVQGGLQYAGARQFANQALSGQIPAGLPAALAGPGAAGLPNPAAGLLGLLAGSRAGS